jgi:hypothetical protein
MIKYFCTLTANLRHFLHELLLSVVEKGRNLN